MSPIPMPRFFVIYTTVNTAAKIKKVVCNVSVHTTVLIPPLKVYNKIIIINTTAGTQNGMFQALKTYSYRTNTTRYILRAEPSSLERMKKAAPVRSEWTPKRISR